MDVKEWHNLGLVMMMCLFGTLDSIMRCDIIRSCMILMLYLANPTGISSRILLGLSYPFPSWPLCTYVCTIVNIHTPLRRSYLIYNITLSRCLITTCSGSVLDQELEIYEPFYHSKAETSKL